MRLTSEKAKQYLLGFFVVALQLALVGTLLALALGLDPTKLKLV